jgi:hypothetical protein
VKNTYEITMELSIDYNFHSSELQNKKALQTFVTSTNFNASIESRNLFPGFFIEEALDTI